MYPPEHTLGEWCSSLFPQLQCTCRSVTGKSTAGSRRYEFDSVLGEQASQEEVYAEVRELVQSAHDGFNVWYVFESLAACHCYKEYLKG